MTKTNSTGTAELADLRPAEGEYFYTDASGFSRYHWHSPSPTCFVCGKKESRHQCINIHAIAQCLAAGRRIAAMFKPEACYGPELDPCLKPGACVIISACEAHQHCAEILYRLTTDGVITLERVWRAEQAQISRSEFNKLVAEAARAIWSDHENERKRRNWYDAWDLFLKEKGRIPSLAERTERAEFLWEERKGGQSQADWLEAEKKVAALYTPDAQ